MKNNLEIDGYEDENYELPNDEDEDEDIEELEQRLEQKPKFSTIQNEQMESDGVEGKFSDKDYSLT